MNYKWHYNLKVRIAEWYRKIPATSDILIMEGCLLVVASVLTVVVKLAVVGCSKPKWDKLEAK